MLSFNSNFHSWLRNSTQYISIESIVFTVFDLYVVMQSVLGENFQKSAISPHFPESPTPFFRLFGGEIFICREIHMQVQQRRTVSQF